MPCLLVDPCSFCFFIQSIQERLWQKRFYVLHGATTGNQARLDFYDNQENFNQNSTVHGTMYIGDIEKVIHTKKHKDKEHTFDIVLKHAEKVRTFATDSEKDLIGWTSDLRSAIKSKDNKTDNLFVQPGMVTLGGSQNSLDRGDSPAFDENVIYESAENRKLPLKIRHIKKQLWHCNIKPCYQKLRSSNECIISIVCRDTKI